MSLKFVLCVFVILFDGLDHTFGKTNKVVCYHGTWSKYRSGNGNFGVANIDPNLCTHLIYSFIGINADGSMLLLDEYLDITSGNFASFNALKLQNTNLKTLVAVGGWNEGSLKYSTMAASADLRATFIQSALTLVQTYGFDGFDLDWEYPALRGGASTDNVNFATLIKEMRAVFDEHNLLLTAAVAATAAKIDVSYDVPVMSEYLDFINVMTYDIHGSWDGVTGQNAPLYASSIDTTDDAKALNVKSCIEAWIERGADPQKLILGLGTYGRSFTLASSDNTALGAATTGAGTAGPYTLEAGYLGYNEICEKQLEGGWTVVWDDEQKNPYMYNGDQWVGYDNARSIALKVNFAISLNLGGAMIWAIETEDHLGLCGSTYPLLNAIKSSLASSSDDSTTVSSSTTAAATTEAATTEAATTEAATTEAATTETATTASTTTEAATTESATTEAATTEAAVSAATVSSSVCTTGGTYVRDSSNCNIYYYCSVVGTAIVPLVRQCSAGLYYDTASGVCNWPANVSGC